MGNEDHQPPATPSWLTEPCPEWCTREHREEDHPEDQLHQDDGILIAAVFADLPDMGHATSSELLVRRSRRPHDPTTWVFLGDPLDTRRCLTLSQESVQRLRVALG